MEVREKFPILKEAVSAYIKECYDPLLNECIPRLTLLQNVDKFKEVMKFFLMSQLSALPKR
jgi:hypothetical protein